ncbi:MAG: CDP-alcohol phosphatidyltransferase family protein [Clostridia bacterium]|nr:CDP-alcohol phosphatidyltransferase family protein [Clostridia bacterium]MBR4955852.1 CDP-alcohol phosphatidyltransferase family protein [Clostridia bacterium]MBR5903504.1 CDP-alcohol phosphatidyltransferase family protein [Clostridia bacterium]
MQDNDHLKKIITLPNILSLVRLLLIPVFCVVYVSMEEYKPAAAILLLSGLTDVVDGFVARRFNMVSDLGKVLDPAADKLTQLAVLACLISRFKRMSLPCIMLAVKELLSGIAALLAVKKTKVVLSAEWHGKLTTMLLYTMMVTHILWYDIPTVVSDVMISLCVSAMLLSFVLYTVRNIKMIRGKYSG